MKAAVLSAPQEIRVEEVPDPVPGAAEVLIQVAACGVCGTDMHTLAGKNSQVRFPVIPGHEFVGTVTGLGDGVTTLQVGDRVAVDPSRSCGRCAFCRSSRPNLCRDKGGHGSRIPGGFAELVVAREASCVALPADLSWDRAVLAEPLACVLHGMDRLGPVLGKNALVFGAGAIGMLTAALLHQAGASVQMTERAPARLAVAREWGFECAESADEFGNDLGWEVVVDATGVPAAIQEAFTRVGSGGTLLMMGVAPADATIEIAPYRVNWQELTIIGSMAIQGTFQRAVELLPKLDLPLETLVTHRVPLAEIDRAYELVRSRDALKVVVA